MKTTKHLSIADVRSERARLQLKLRALEEEIRDNYTSLKVSLKPGNLFHLIMDGNPVSEPSPLPDKLSKLGGSLLNFLISGVFMKNSGIIKRLVASSVIQKIGPYLFKNGLPLITELIAKVKANSAQKKQTQRVYDSTTAYDFNS